MGFKDFLESRRKAITGYVGAAIVSLAADAHIAHIPKGVTALIAGGIVAAVIERIPNK
jgi:hypothetical protein